MILLDSKFFVPQLPSRMVPRRRLLEGLDEALHRKLTLVSAPAGSGKTTLLSEWVLSRQPRLKVAWLSLGKTENEPYRFWRYFLAVLAPLTTEDLSNFLNQEQTLTPDDLEELIEIIDHEIRDSFVLVLDDFHLISDPSVHEALTYLLDYLPPQMHVIIASRTRLPLVISHLRVRNQLLEYTLEDLKFNQLETESFMRQRVLGEFSTDEIAQLNQKTEGWVAGLQLAALSMQARSLTDLHAFLASFSGTNRNIDFLARRWFHPVRRKRKNIQ